MELLPLGVILVLPLVQSASSEQHKFYDFCHLSHVLPSSFCLLCSIFSSFYTFGRPQSL